MHSFVNHHLKIKICKLHFLNLEEKTKSVDFNHPLYVLFSSGTTGLPKCITHGHGGSLLQHLKELSLHNVLVSSD